MMKSRFFVVLLGLVFFVLPAAAKNIYRDCGIGALIFPKTGWAAVTSNIIWDLGLTASFSTTTSESQCAGRSASAAKFIHQNYAILEEETATGNGPHLVTMLNILDCSHSSHASIISTVRSDFSKNLNSESYSFKVQNQKSEIYFNNLMEIIESNFSSQCQAS